MFCYKLNTQRRFVEIVVTMQLYVQLYSNNGTATSKYSSSSVNYHRLAVTVILGYCAALIQAGKNGLEFTGRGMTPSTWRCHGWGTELHPGEFVPVPDCAGEGVASVVRAAAETLVLEAVVASSSTFRLTNITIQEHASTRERINISLKINTIQTTNKQKGQLQNKRIQNWPAIRNQYH